MNTPLRDRPPMNETVTHGRNVGRAIGLWVVVAGLSIAGCAGAPWNVNDSRIDCGGGDCNAICELPPSAHQDDPHSDLMARHAYWNGRRACISEGRESAVRWYRTAAEHGQPAAMSRIGDGGQSAPARRALVVMVRWKDCTPGLDKPHGAAGQVAGKLGASAVIGGAFVLVGDPVRAAAYGGTLAIAGIIEGLKTGRAARTIHRELEASFSSMRFGDRVREALEQWLLESGMRPVPRVPSAGSIAAESRAPRPDASIELSFEKAALRSTRRAWQFHPDNTPELILVIQARARILREGKKQPVLDTMIEYRGQRVLNGGENTFQAEMRRAVDHIADTVLRGFAGARDLPDGGAPPQTAQPDALTAMPDPVRRHGRNPRGGAPCGSM